MSAVVRQQSTESANATDWQTRTQIRDFAHTTDAVSLMLEKLGFRQHKHRDVVCALQGVAGGRSEFNCSHHTLARRLDHNGKDSTAEAYAARKIMALEKEQRRTGRVLFAIERGGGIEHKPMRYTDYITPAANWLMRRARADDLWKEHPGKALAAHVDEAIQMLPPYYVEDGEAGTEHEPVPAGVRIARNRSHVISRARANFEIILENGGDVVAHAESLSTELLERAHLIAQGAYSASEEAEESSSLQKCEVEGDSEEFPILQICEVETQNLSEIEEIPSNVDAALIYAGRGWPVFPCADGGKKPLIIEWQNRATTDEKTIREWWRKWPNANIGIVTGAASGFIVLDIDPRHGGDASLTELIEPHGELPTTMRALTGGGGQHLLFAHPGVAIKNSSSLLGEGLDIRGDGGYIVAPPSLHKSGRMYEWLNATRPAPLPEWLLKRLTQEKEIPLGSAAPKTRLEGESGATNEGLINEGGRNDFLFRRVASWRAGKGESYEEIEAAVLEANERQCSPPLDAIECQKIARSAYTLESRKHAVMGA